MRLTPTEQMRRYEKMTQRLSEGVRATLDEVAAKRTLAGRMFKSTEIKQGPVHGWGKASESLHRARGATSPLGGQAKT